MKTLSISRWLLLLLWLGLLNLTISLVFPGCGVLDGLDFPIADTPVLRNVGVKPPATAVQAPRRKAFLSSNPTPEGQWNQLGLWQKIHSAPPTYVPKGYVSAPSNGTWFVDPRDGKRLLAPNTSYLNLSPGVWEGEARKITGY